GRGMSLFRAARRHARTGHRPAGPRTRDPDAIAGWPRDQDVSDLRDRARIQDAIFDPPAGDVETTVVHRTDQAFGVQHYVEVRAAGEGGSPTLKRRIQAQRRTPRREGSR